MSIKNIKKPLLFLTFAQMSPHNIFSDLAIKSRACGGVRVRVLHVHHSVQRDQQNCAQPVQTYQNQVSYLLVFNLESFEDNCATIALDGEGRQLE